MEPAAEGEGAVLLVKWEGVQLQLAGQHSLDGPVVLHEPGGVDVDVGDGRGLSLVHAARTHTHKDNIIVCIYCLYIVLFSRCFHPEQRTDCIWEQVAVWHLGRGCVDVNE